MSKKIILKESQYRRMLLLLTENNSNSILSNIKPDDVLKITSDNNDVIIIKVKNINNGVLDGFDNNDEEIIIDMNNYSDSNKEIIVSKVNPISKSMVNSVIKVSNIEMLDGDIDDIEDERVDDEGNYDDDKVFNKYYKDIINNPDLKKAFYTAPTLWDYLVAKAKGKKAKGKRVTEFKLGSKSPDLIPIQRQLVKLGYEIDSEEIKQGKFGVTTVEAVKQFQTINQLYQKQINEICLET
jgi:hypothetical protein